MLSLKAKLIRITTIPLSLKVLLKGQHQFMSNHFEVIGVSSPGKELEEIKYDEGIEVISVNMSRKITPFQDLKSLRKMYQFLKKEKPQIVHTHTPKAGIVGMLAARLAGVPHRLHTVAGLPLMEATGVKRKVLDFVEKLTYSSATGVYPNSKGLYDFILQNNYISKEKLKVIANGSSNGIDTSYFSPDQITPDQKESLKRNLNIGGSDFVFVFVGRLVGDKGINELVKGFEMMSKMKNLPSTPKLLLVGPLETDLDPLHPETLKEIENNKSIIVAGFQKDVRPYFAIADALVFPSYREGFPNVVMQAGAMGLPSIVSNINGCNEIIIEDKNGIIVPVKNIEKLQNAMERVMTDADYYDQLKKNARSMIQSRYEQSVIWNALLNEYKTLLKQDSDV
ncbi:MAG: glycosyltransferase family 4 protein [Chryseobacterium sp.]|uniref:glycosyltransferase family 4 protein n=1 Tax=Chryseobacterium sp. TaxID=1871047 RepID=UPI0025BB9DA0|nr:glycosyltransferase family 4 protein [Chryseobacterium sp.]MCJ7933008.1 glycosyltransferase family 4 protein [Chryseobacterium sp.]